MRQLDERIDALKSGSEWDEVVRDLQSSVAECVATAFRQIEEATRRVTASFRGAFSSRSDGPS